jgi:hypothetical protein
VAQAVDSITFSSIEVGSTPFASASIRFCARRYIIVSYGHTIFRPTHQQIPQQHRNRNLSNRRHINRRLFLDLRRKVAFTREINAHGSIAHLLKRHLVLVARYAADHHVAERQAVFERPAGLFDDFVAALAETDAPSKFLHVADVDAVYSRAVVCEQGCEWSADDLASVDDRDCTPMQPVSVGQNRVIYPQILQNLDNCEWCAGQYALLRVRGIEEANVLVHVEDVAMRQALDVFVDGHDLLEVLVLPVAEDGVVDHYAVDGGIVVGVDEGVFKEFPVDFAEVEGEATTVN